MVKLGGPWNLRGLRPEAREAARAAARRSGVSVGEWLNDVIRPDDDDDAFESGEADHADDDRGRSASHGDSDYAFDGDPPGVRGRTRERHRRHGEGENPRSRGQERYAANGRERAEEPRQQERARTHAVERERPLERDRDELARAEEQKRERINELESERARELATRQERTRDRDLAPEQERNRERQRAQERHPQQARERQQEREPESEFERTGDRASVKTEHGAPNHEALSAQDDPGDLHGRLDKLSSQLERLTRSGAVQRRLLSRETKAPAESTDDSRPPLTGAPATPRGAARRTIHNRPPSIAPDLSIDQAVAEIAARQRVLNGETAVAIPAVPPQVAAPVPTASAEARPAEPVNLSGLERQLRDMTARIEELRPSSELASTINAIRTDLADIGRHLSEALPRQAVESIDSEIKALSQRIDESRQAGGDATAIAGLERGLVEVREALRGLTTAESLVGFDEAVKGLNQKLDLIAAKDDPAALQQLETAIGALRGIVSHVASNETLNRVAEDVRALASKVDDLAHAGMNGHALSALEGRIETLASALTASAEAGQTVPHEFEKLLSGLIEKLEWVQLTHTDHAALAHLEDRIATLVQRFDASDARLIHLEAIERGIADLLVYLEGMGAHTSGAMQGTPGAVDALEQRIPKIRQNERRTQDALEAVQGTVEHVVDRLARIESGMRLDPPDRSAESKQESPSIADFSPHPAAEPVSAARFAVAVPATVDAEPASTRGSGRRPIDPDLPPDHPLEPGSASGRTRPAASAADRIAASEAAASLVKPPIIPDPGGKSDFIAAARRAAQAAAAAPAGPEKRAKAAKRGLFSLPKGAMKRVRTLLVAGSAVLILIVCLHIATRMFVDGVSAPAPRVPAEKASPTAAAPTAADPAILAPSQAAQFPDHSTPPATMPSVPPAPSSAAPTASPRQQSRAQDGGDQTESLPAPLLAKKPTAGAMPLWANPDITGSLLPRGTPAKPLPAAAPTVATAVENLPVAIGGPELRKAAAAGDAAAAYEVAMRFADGRGVTQNYDQAAQWLQRAADAGLAPAKFRLGTFYEKGTGVKKDLATARDLYLAAANKGNGKAMHNLAVLYAEGIDGPTDYHAASVWFRKAADHGVADSEYNLGILYARGIGVPQNFAESYKWFALAADQGDNEAAKKRDEVAGKLDPQELTAARFTVQTWTAEPQPDDAINVKVPAGGWDLPPRGAQSLKPKAHLSSAKATGSTTAIY